MFIKVKVFPSSKKQKVVKKANDSFSVWVKEKPVKSLANQAVKQVLAGYFNLPLEKIRLIKGFQQRNKIFKINFVPDGRKIPPKYGTG